MAFQLEQRDGRLWASGDMTIYAAADMKDQLLVAIEACGKATDVTIDLSQIVELDTCGLQMLLLAQRSAAAAGGRLVVLQPSAVVLDVLGLCGMNDLFCNDLRRVA